MVTEKEIDAILKYPAWRKIPTSKIPTWVMKDGLEGVEIFEGKIRTFWMKKDGSGVTQKVYGEPASEGVSQIYQAFNEQKIQQDDEKTMMIPCMPDYLTDALVEKYAKMTAAGRLMMVQNTDKRYIKHRPGRAGSTYDYVEGHYMHQAANLAFLFMWESDIKDMKITDTEVIVWGHVAGVIDGCTIKKASVGQQDIKFRKDTKIPLCLGDDVKAAVTDMEKKGLSKFGIAADVYRGDV